jgi:hypothetical protein
MFEVSGPKSCWHDHYYRYQQNQWNSAVWLQKMMHLSGALTFICWWSVARSMHFLGLRGTMPRSKINAPSPYVASMLFPKQPQVQQFLSQTAGESVAHFFKENRCRKRETNESCCWDGFRNFNHLRQRHAKFTQFTSSLFHTNYSRFHCFHFLWTSRSSHRVHVR